MTFRSTVATVFAACTVAVLHAADFTGNWEGMVTMPDGVEMKVVYAFTMADGRLSGIVQTSAYGDFAMEGIKVEGDTIAFKVASEGGDYAHAGKLGAEGISMAVTGPEGPFPPLLFKRPAVDVTGKWRGRIQGPDGEADLVFTLAVREGRLSGTVQGPFGEAPLTNTSINGNEVAFDTEYQGYLVRRAGKVDGDKMQLVIKVEDYQANVVLTRDPPAAPAPAKTN